MLAFRNKLLVGSFGLYTVASRFYARPSAFAMSSSSHQSKEVHVEQFLNYNYKPAGQILKLKDDTEFYAVGSPRSKRGVIVVPDLGGFNAGNSRNIADYLAAKGSYVAIPSIIGTPKGASEYAPNFLETQSLGEYSKAQILDANMKPKIRSLVKQMKDEGVEKIALIGFSWGGWVATNVLASNDLADQFTCGILAHPSINLEERMYGGSLAQLFSHVKRPVLVLPARGDPHEYDSFVQMLNYRCPSSDVIDYRDYEHNFLLRGRIDDRDIRRADIKALHEISSYLNYHFDYEAGELNRHAEKITGSQGSGHQQSSQEDQRTWTDYLQESYKYMREGVAQSFTGTWEQTKQGTQQLGDSLREGTKGLAHQLKEDAEKAREAFDRTVYHTREEYEKAKHSTQEQAQKLRDSAAQSIRRLREEADKAVENVERSAYRTDEEFEQARKHANEQARRMRQDAEQTEREAEDRWNRSKHEASENWEQFKERTQQARNQAGEYMQHTGEKAQDTWEQTKQGTKEACDKTKEGVQQTRNQTSDYAQQSTWSRTKEGAQQTRNKASEYAQQTGEGAQDTWDKTKQGAQETHNKAGEYVQQAGERTQEAWNKTKEGAQKAGEYAQQTSEKAKEAADKTRQRAGEAAEQVKERTQETGQSVGEATKTAGERLKESVQSVGETIKRTFTPGDKKGSDDDSIGGSSGQGR
jgi:dienelactone hydrolase/ElaB/YqjD/DUF883 family membrane-anchored ribosome-binding protein